MSSSAKSKSMSSSAKSGNSKGMKLMSKFQNLAKALLIPLALICFGSLTLGIASILSEPRFIEALPFLGAAPVQYVSTILLQIGLIILANLGVIYAISLSFAMVTKDQGFAAFSGFIGYFTLMKSMNLLLGALPDFAERFPQNGITTVLGIETVNIGILGGILTGMLVVLIHNRFRDVRLPMVFAFFQGVRLVPIMSIIIMTLVGQVLPFIWLYVQQAIQLLGSSLDKIGVFGPFVYGTVERLLIPTGLHQIWNAMIKNTAISGTFIFPSGAIVEGGLPAYSQFLAEGALPTNASLQEMVKYLFGPQNAMMLGAVPGIGLALYRCADPDKRSYVKPLILSGVATAFLVGITEPLEFIFLFAAPALFGVYALLTGLTWLFSFLLGSGVGGANSGIIYFFINGVLKEGSRWWILVPIMIVQFFACYFLFKWWIIRFNVKTPGRGGDYDDAMEYASEIAGLNLVEKADKKSEKDAEKGSPEFNTTNPEILKAQMIIHGLGGKDNILEVENCMSRLRITVADGDLVDEDVIKKTRCNGIIKVSPTDIQIVYGTTVNLIKKTIDKELQK